MCYILSITKPKGSVMSGQLNIFDGMVNNLQAQIEQLEQDNRRLAGQNVVLSNDVEHNRKYLNELANSDWQDRKETENDIRDAEREISGNNEIIKKNNAKIQELRAQLQTQRDLSMALNDQIKSKRR